MNNEWITVADAAKILGVSKQAIRQRIYRDTIPHRKSPGGTVFVRITEHNPEAKAESYGEDTGHMEGVGRNELLDELRDRVGFLEHQLETEQAASAELRRIVAGLVQRVPELEAAPEPPSESPESAHEGSGSSTAAPEEQEEKQTSRPWWRGLFGG